MAGRDMLAQAPTGSGKTLAFGVPLVERITAAAAAGGGRTTGPAALVLVPTRELATQVATEIAALAAGRLRVATAFGGVGQGPQDAAARRAAVLVACPGRLIDLLGQRLVDLRGVRDLVLDEADRMLDMGFAPQVERVLAVLPARRRTSLFSATLDGAVGDLARRHTRDAVTRTVAAQTADDHRTTLERIDHRFAAVPAERKVDALVDALGAGKHERAIVFTRTKRGADRVVRRLGQGGIGAAVLHGGKSQGQRTRALADFAAGRTDVLVATDIAARGIDLPDVTHVVNFDVPAEAADYVHRAGRTARAGRGGMAVTLVTPEEERDVARLAATLRVACPFVVGSAAARSGSGRRSRSGRERMAMARG